MRVIILLLLITGCSTMTENGGASNNIPNQVGEPDAESGMTDYKDWTTEGISEKAGYEPYTNKFFEGIHLTTTYHRVDPGAKVGTNESFPNEKIRVQLVERGKDLEEIEVVKEEVFTKGEKLRVQLPEKEGAVYTYSQEVLSEDHEILDTDVAIYHVPPEELNARMYTEREVLGADDTLEIQVENWGPTHLNFGKPYSIEKYSSGAWENISGDQSFEMIGYQLEPGKTHTQEIDLARLDVSSGTYRVIKTFEAANTELSTQLAVEFEIE
ncbi:immunoglobulin-like domain-containing protein [Halobacillus campisalis]|uniref:Immunoglobulin-like domain-containing protein n=1 Tax=Halobacillus campisalis TaxID=435909 RepID=A0ABW2K472_9BACI|nr:immunoglobulin-like domain-containing protein [Halobacillus campisalis]